MYQIIKRTISLILAALMLLCVIPQNTAYGAVKFTNAKDARKVSLTGYYSDITNRIFFSKGFSGSGLQGENSKALSVLYDFDPTNAYYEGNWSNHTLDGNLVIRPGKRHSAGIGFIVDLEAHNMLGSAMKGQLIAYSTIYYNNYSGDNDWGAPFITTFDSGGNTKVKHIGNYVRTTEWTQNATSLTLASDSRYVMFGGSGYRRDGVLNENLDVNLYSLMGELHDNTSPQVISISSQNEYIKQINPEPLLYITMSEDISGFSNMTASLTATDGSTYNTGLEFKGKESFNYSNGDVTYKFRVKLEDLNNVKKNFTKITLKSIRAEDTFGNATTDTRNLSISKRIDTMPPGISFTAPNLFKVSDYFGLSKVTTSLNYGNITNTNNLLNPGTEIKIDNAPKKTNPETIAITNSTTYTGEFKAIVDAWDLANNKTTANIDLFMISDSNPVLFDLINSDSPMFAYSPDTISEGAANALTNMYLKTNIDAKYLSGAEIYYKWHNSYDEGILTQDPTVAANNWKNVSFKANYSETYPITIPVQKVSEGFISYLKPKYEEGYLYIIPFMKDDTVGVAKLRTGSVALSQTGADTGGKFSLVDSNPVKGNFVNRGCECTGQSYLGDSAEAHYSAVRDHTKSIGINITAEDHQYLSSIKYFISTKGDNASYIDQGTIAVNTGGNGQYDIPITKIAGKTGSYTVMAALYSNKGDVTLQTIDVNIENPIISVGSILYNQVTKNLDFTVTYKKDSIISSNLDDIIIQFCSKEYTGFQDVETGTDKISFYSAALSNDWDASALNGDTFIRTEFSPDSSDSSLMKANFRAFLSNMEKAGDEFIKVPGEKQVHLKYITSNNVEKVHNNITVIKKSNLPPSISLAVDVQGKYQTATEYTGNIIVDVEEVIVDLKEVYYGWADSASLTLITSGGAIAGTPVTLSDLDKKVQFKPDISQITDDKLLYETRFLLVYAENSAGKIVEKALGPFYVLNEDINNKRFMITSSDKALGKEQVLIAVDDRLYMIDELPKADTLRVTWEKSDGTGDTKITNEYDLSFETNVSLINVPYPKLWDTDGEGGTYKLSKIEIFNSSDSNKVFKSSETEIEHTLSEYFVTIQGLTDSVKVTSSSDEIEYGWTINPYAPPSWISTQGAIKGINFIPNQRSSLLNSYIYLTVKAWNNIYSSDKILLKAHEVNDPVDVTVNLGEGNNLYYGPENGVKDTLIKLSVTESVKLNDIAEVQVYDLLSSTSGTAINVDKLFKISDTEAYGVIAGLVTSGGAIQCKVVVNDLDTGNITVNRSGGIPPNLDMSFIRDNRSITFNNVSECSNFTLYDDSGMKYFLDNTGKTEIFSNGRYLLLYKEGTDMFAKVFKVDDVKYVKEDVDIILDPVKPNDGSKVEGPVTATITMPLGSVITDRYGIITDVENIGSRTVAKAEIIANANYSFNVKFVNGNTENYTVEMDYILEKYVPDITNATSHSAINYDPQGPELTIKNVKATIDETLSLVNNEHRNSYEFDINGSYSFIVLETDGSLSEYKAEVSWIDKKCPEPIVKKYIWYDYDNDRIYDIGEKGIEIPEGYTTKHNLIVEISFPMDAEGSHPVKLSGSEDFTMEDVCSERPEFAYKYVMAYKPNASEGNQPKLVVNLNFTDTLGNILDYGLIIDEIDRTDLLTKLNYSTTEYTNSDVVVSMSSNKKIKRFDIVNKVEKDASPTYVFKENGAKDFHYREIETTEPEEGKLTANVTWIDKTVPRAEVSYDIAVTKNDVEISFRIINGAEQGARLRLINGNDAVLLEDSGLDRIGSYTVDKNGTYIFEISNKYGSTGSVFVPVNNIDKEAPEISIAGRAITYIKAGSKYYDKGATALDNRDQDVTKGISVSSNVNSSIATKGTPYTVTYSVTDEAGNTSEAVRYVHVLDIDSAVAVINDKVIDLKEQGPHDVFLTEGGIVMMEFVGIDGTYAVKYAKGTGYDNAYFKTNGSHMSKFGTFIAEEGKYTLYLQDQERNTRIITLNFVK